MGVPMSLRLYMMILPFQKHMVAGKRIGDSGFGDQRNSAASAWEVARLIKQ